VIEGDAMCLLHHSLYIPQQLEVDSHSFVEQTSLVVARQVGRLDVAVATKGDVPSRSGSLSDMLSERWGLRLVTAMRHDCSDSA